MDDGPNVKLLNETLDYIKAHPEEWNQAVWRCGTAACFAGHAAILAGARWACTRPHPDGECGDMQMVAPDGATTYVDTYARKALGLDGEQADALFDAGNTLKDLKRMVAALSAGLDITTGGEQAHV